MKVALQFAARLSNYFDKWIELSEMDKLFEGLRELMIAEQLFKRCSPELTEFLKERKPRALAETLELADRFMEAQGLKKLTKMKQEPSKLIDNQKQKD